MRMFLFLIYYCKLQLAVVENYRTGSFWKMMRQCPYLAAGLSRAGFSGGWLG